MERLLDISIHKIYASNSVNINKKHIKNKKKRKFD